MFGWFRRRRRRKILSQPWPQDWDLHLNRNVRLTWNLSDDENMRLRNRIRIFLAEKHWEGCEGLEVTEEMKVTVAAQACLMLLGVEGFYFENVRSILLFPQAFSRSTTDGLSQNQKQFRAGEAWQDGPVVLSWRDSLQGGRNEDDGKNVVIHEFAHALDGIDGEMGGNVVFDDRATAADWTRVVEREFADLVEAKERGRRTLLDHYGATNLAEFFAVSSETFFELPDELHREHNALFDLLEKYYRVNPTSWQNRRPRR